MARVLPIVLGLAAAGALGAFVSVVVTGDGSNGGAAPASSSDSELRARVDELVQEVSRLREDVKTLRLAPPMREIAPSAIPSGDADVPMAMDAEAAAGAVPEAIRESVEAVVEEKQAEMQERMGRRFSAMREQREKATLDKLAEDHGLTAYQRTEMEAILAKRREVIGGFFRSMFSGTEDEVDMAAARDKVRKVQQESDAQIKELLTAEQYDTYQPEQSQRGFMGPGMRGGPGGGRGPGGGGR